MFATLHIILLSGFLVVTLLLMLINLVSRLRMQREVLLAWRRGPLWGVPLWPLAFMALVSGLMLYTRLAGSALDPALFAGYLVGGGFWLVGVLLGTTVLITDAGLIAPLQRTRRLVAWAQIIDYFETERDGERLFVFFYVDAAGNRCRLDLKVPAAYYDRFRRIVRSQIDARMDYSVQQTYGKKALEG